MARKKEGGSRVREGLRKLWKHVSASTWCQMLREVAPQNDWQLAGQTIKGRCPYHDDTDPSFVLDFSKGFGRCYGSCGKYVWDIISLFAHIMKTSYADAYLWLDERINLSEVMGKDSADQVGTYSVVQAMKKAAAIAFSQVLQEYIREKPDYLSYLEPGFLYLTKGRNIPVDVIGALPVALYPKPEHAKKYMPEEYHAAYDQYFQKYQSANYWGAVIFHYNDSPGNISRFKVRLMEKHISKLLSAVRSLEHASAAQYKKLFTHDFRFMDDQYSEGVGVFGLHHYSRSIGSTESCVYVTEGEFDALSVMAGQIATGRYDVVMLASGGKGDTSLGFLREFGLRIVYLVQDSPSKNGDSVAAAFLRNKLNFTRDAGNVRLQFKIFSWPVELLGGDLDEAVQLAGYETVSSFLTDSNNFLNALPWVEQKCMTAIDTLRNMYDSKMASAETGIEESIRELEENHPDGWEQKVETNKASLEAARKNNEDDFMRDASDVVRQWGQCLCDPSDLKVYLQACSQKLGRDITEIGMDGSGVYRPDTGEGAVTIIRNALSNYLTMAYYTTEKTTQFYMWSHTKHEVVPVPSSDTQFSMMFSQHIGMPLIDWMKTHLGANSVLDEKCKDPNSLDAERKRAESARFIMRQVLEGMSASCPAKDELRVMGQGIHYTDVTPEAKRKRHVYLVNGAKLFRGTYGTGAGVPVEWEFLNTNVDCGMLFNLKKEERWSEIDDVDQLYAATRVDLQDLYRKVQSITRCWKFKENDIMQKFVPAWILAAPVMTAMGFVSMIFLQGQSTSGKTFFTQGLLGGLRDHTHQVPPLLEGAKYAMNATPAWLQREANKSTLLMCLDEVEDDQKTDHGDRMKEIQHMLYSVPTGGSVITRAGQDADKKIDYFMCMPVIMAGIKMYSDNVFMSRIFVLQTEKSVGMPSQEEAISSMFTDEEFADIRRQTTIAMLPYMPQLVLRANVIKRKLDASTKIAGGNTRFVRLVLPALAVLSLADPDEDIDALYLKLVDINRDRLEAINHTESMNDVLDAVLNLPGIKAPNSEGITDYQRARTLIQNGEIILLNNADCGVYCIPSKKWIIVIWKVARHNIFRQTYRYASMSEASLREAALQSTFIVKDVSTEEHDFIVKYLNKPDIHSRTEYSVLKLDAIMTKEDQDALAESFSGMEHATGLKKGQRGNGGNALPPMSVYESEADSVPYTF